MKGFRIIIIALVTIILGCPSKPQIANDFLLGNWYVSDILAENVTVFGKPFNTDMEGQQTFEFTIDKIYMHFESTYVNTSDTTDYQFSTEDSTVTINYNGETETMILNIINKNEFEIVDNMGLVLKVKREK